MKNNDIVGSCAEFERCLCSLLKKWLLCDCVFGYMPIYINLNDSPALILEPLESNGKKRNYFILVLGPDGKEKEIEPICEVRPMVPIVLQIAFLLLEKCSITPVNFEIQVFTKPCMYAHVRGYEYPPQNYDFGKNWKRKVVPHLDDPRLLRAVERGINEFCASFAPPLERGKGHLECWYDSNRSPASYSWPKETYDAWMNKKLKYKLEELRSLEILPRDYLTLEENIERALNDGASWIDVDELVDSLAKYASKIVEPYLSWNKVRYDLESYVLTGGCHWWAKSFELVLARLVEPDEMWFVKGGREMQHSTVINAARTKVFDLLYWAGDGRLLAYLFGTMKRVKTDVTLGGAKAYCDSEKLYV
jgi:hypothetical protein